MHSKEKLQLIVDTRDRLVELGFDPSQARWPKGSGENSGRWRSTSINTKLVRNNRATRKAMSDQLTKQGQDSFAPIRGVVGRDDFTAVARNSKGKIVGGVAFSVNKYGKQIQISQVRALEKRGGIGQNMIKTLADYAGTLPGGDKYEMVVYGAIEDAIPWYALTGAEFENPFSSRGRWSPEVLKMIREGKKPPKGRVRERGKAYIPGSDFSAEYDPEVWVELRYNPNQPRWPRGTGKGGQWRGGANWTSVISSLDKAPPPAMSLKQKLQLKLAEQRAKGDVKTKGKAPTKAQIGKYLPPDHPMKPVRKPRAKKAETPTPQPEKRLGTKMPRTSKPEAAGPSIDELTRKMEELAKQREKERLANPKAPLSSKLKDNLVVPGNKTALKRTLTAIDRVHVDSTLVPIPVEEDRLGTAYGAYERYTNKETGALLPQHMDRLVLNRASIPYPHVTLAHEIGHFFDSRVFGNGGLYGSQAQRSYYDKDRANQAWLDLDNALYESPTMTQNSMFMNTHRSPEVKRYGAYLNSQHETFARAYAQWIAVRSGDKELIGEIDTILEEQRRRRIEGFRQHWEWSEFNRVAPYFDRVFRAEGYLK